MPTFRTDVTGGRLSSSVRTVIKALAAISAFFIAWLSAGTVSGGSMGAAWAPSSSQPYPIVRVYSCLNQFKKHFPGGWAAAERDLIAATNEWFVGGGAHIRLVYKGSLPDTDAACADVPTIVRPAPLGNPPQGPVPPAGTVVVTAAPELRSFMLSRSGSGWKCEVSATDLWPAGNGGYFPRAVGRITRARITLIEGESCSGTYTSWPWRQAAGPVLGDIDYWSVLMHELGHALGLRDETAAPSVMNTPHSKWPVFKRHLFRDDVATLRAWYGPMQSKPFHATSTTNGQSWTIPLYQPEPLSAYSLGQAACFQPTPPDPGKHYFVANTEVDGRPTGTLSTYISDKVAATSTRYMTHELSNLPPAVACGAGVYLMAFVDPDGLVMVKRSTDAQAWSLSIMPANVRAGVAPSLAFVSWTGYYLLVAADPANGNLQFLVSRDGGFSFAIERVDQSNIFLPVPTACLESIHECALFAQNDSYWTRRDSLGFDASGKLTVPLAGYGPLESFGGSMSTAGGAAHAWMLVFAAAGANRFPRQLGVGFKSNMASPTWFDSPESFAWNIVSDSTPSALWDPAENKWVLWLTNYYFYNSEVGYVAAWP